jgi:hypothetical protein
MVQVDVFIAGSMGSALAYCARRRLVHEDQWFLNRFFVGNMLLTALVTAPSMLFFLCAFPAWDTMYMFDNDRGPAWLPPLFVGAVIAASLGGFLAGHRLLLEKRQQAALLLPLAFLAPCLLVLAWGWDRILHVGDAASYDAGASANLLSSPLMGAMVFDGLGLVVIPAVLLGLNYRRTPPDLTSA